MQTLSRNHYGELRSIPGGSGGLRVASNAGDGSRLTGRGSNPADAKTMGRWGLALGPDAVEKIHERVVEIANENQVVQGRKMRLDTTVVETNIHYPTDSNLLGDGVRVLIRAMKRIADIAGQQGAKLRDRSRSVKCRVSGNRARSAHQGLRCGFFPRRDEIGGKVIQHLSGVRQRGGDVPSGLK